MAASLKCNSIVGTRVVASQQKAVRASAASPVLASLRSDVAQFAKAAGLGAASLALALSAGAATVKLGTDTGALAFDPATVTIKAGDSVEWVNNAGFPHNVVFDEDAIPVGSWAGGGHPSGLELDLFG